MIEPQSVSTRFGSLGADGARARLGIMGGTFDPIHLGHLSCAERARQACSLDAVLFVPTGNPNFKQGCVSAPPAERLRMCRLACASNPHFDVSDIEIARGGVTYTVDTVRELRAAFPENVQLGLIMGTDSFLTLPKWRACGAIAQLASFVVVTRPGCADDLAHRETLEALRARLTECGGEPENLSVEFAEGSLIDVSSSELRERTARGLTLRYLVPDVVAGYIAKSGLYRMPPCDEAAASASLAARPDALSDEFYAARAAEVDLRVSAKRAKHIAGVAQAAADLARTYGVDVRKARLAGLLHDWDKGYDDEGIRARIGELGLLDALDPWVVEHMPATLHGPTAAAALAREFPSIPDDVLQAIERHTTGAVDMSDLDKVVYIADAIEESRCYGRIDELRALVGKASLDELFFNTYQYWTLLLLERGKPLHPDTITVWNAYAARHAARKGKKRHDHR